MNIAFVKEGTAEDFFKAISRGMIAQDTGGFYYQLQSGKLVESQDLKNWIETNEFEFGTINGVWNIYREEKNIKEEQSIKTEKDIPTYIREHVLKLANSSVVKGFYSSGVSKRLNVPLIEVEEELRKMVEERLVQKKYQLLCHNGHCLRVLDTKKERNEFQQEYECQYCGEEMEEVNHGFIQEIYTGWEK